MEQDKAPKRELAMRHAALAWIARSFLAEQPDARALAYFGTSLWKKDPPDTDLFVITKPAFDRTPEEVDTLLRNHFILAAQRGVDLARPDTYAILKLDEDIPLRQSFVQLAQDQIDRDSPVDVATKTSVTHYPSLHQLIVGVLPETV
jgi:hypothetical protein